MAKNVGILKPMPIVKSEADKLVGKLKYPIRQKQLSKMDERIGRRFITETESELLGKPEILAPAVKEPENKFIFNISLPSIEVKLPVQPAPNVVVNNEIQPTPINIMPSEVVVNPTPINIMPSEVVVQSPDINIPATVVNVVPSEVVVQNNIEVPTPKVNIRNEIKLQQDPEPVTVAVKRDEFGNIVELREA